MYIYFLASFNDNKFIRMWQYGFKYTHIAICIDDLDEYYHKKDRLNPFVVEMVPPRIRAGNFLTGERYSKIEEFSFFKLKVTENQYNKFFDVLYDLVKKKVKYDWFGILGFPFRSKNIEQKDKFFCSELAFYCLQRAGINLLNYISPSEVSPRLFLTSPLLEYCYTVKYNEIDGKYEEVIDESLQR